jgi:hypothetical protein
MTIAIKNDILRHQLPLLPRPHRLILTDEVASLAEEKLAQIFLAFRKFDEFDADNDPYLEHDFIAVSFEGENLFLKFEYFDSDLRFFQEDGTRVLTIMFSHEY